MNIHVGMIEKALCDFFKSAKSGFQVVENTTQLPNIVQPAISWCTRGGTFETDEKGILKERLNFECLVVAKNVAGEEYRRYEAHELKQKVVNRLSGVSLPLKDDKGNFAGNTGVFEPVSWDDTTSPEEFELKLTTVRVEFSVSIPSQSDSERTETGSESLKECIRLAVKQQLESSEFCYRVIPTLGNWNFENENETLAKVFWSGESEQANKSMSSFTRRQDTLFITIAVPNTPENWQDKTSLIEEKFNYSKISQPAIIPLLPPDKKGSIGIVDILNMSVEHPALPEAFAVSKIAINIQYAIKG